MPELPQKTYDQILDFTQQGESFFENKMYNSAFESFSHALELVPSPKTDWEATTWIYTAMGDCFFQLKKYTEAANLFYDALNCPHAQANPFIHLRLGQCLFENGDKDGAENELFKAYMLDGKDIFKSEQKKYIKFLSEKYDL